MIDRKINFYNKAQSRVRDFFPSLSENFTQKEIYVNLQLRLFQHKQLPLESEVESVLLPRKVSKHS